MQFFSHYKNLKKIIDQNEFSETRGSIFTAILAQVEQKNLMPCKMGLVKEHRQKDRINIENQSFGDQYLRILSQGLQNSGVNFYKLGGNRITETGAVDIISSMQSNVKELDLRQNRIGRLGCMKLNFHLQNRFTLQSINVEDNNLGDESVIQLLSGL